MVPAGLPDPIQQLEDALSATADALEAGDPIAAAAASDGAAEACRVLAARGTPPAPELLARARELQARCEAAAVKVQQRLVGEVERSARSRRAATAYGDHGDQG